MSQDKPVVTQEPVAWFEKTDHGNYPVLRWKQGYSAKIGDTFYDHAAPCARCAEAERIEAIATAKLGDEIIKNGTLQDKITEQASELSRINRIASCGSVDSWMSLSDDDKRKWFAVTLDVDQQKADRIKALEEQIKDWKRWQPSVVRISELEAKLAKADAVIDVARHTIEPFADIKPRMWKTDIENAITLLAAIEAYQKDTK